ncbi:MAG: serine/threonine protein kinase [Ruminococcaceae bacterium]|nr:serine/threonine protein kinase [Oscillospiraceae bacterium]
MLQPGTLICARYQITRLIGRGGMSAVYQARDLSSGKLYAIKDVERNGKANNNVVLQSLTAEGRMLKQLDNPHLPKIYDIIENPNSFMLVMDFIEGESLDKVIAREGAQSIDRVYNWSMQICEVFSYLHSQTPPIVYRDMKPANVILQPNGNIMMIDFGTARTQKSNAMQSDTICIGTAGFAAPEQFGGLGESTARTDIFCLGATIYNLITGHSPCDNPKGILPLERWNPQLAGSPLSYIIAKCTRNDPNERYQTALELRNDLYLASVGAFGAKQGRGRSEKLAQGNPNAWQAQKFKTNGNKSGGLSGLLSFGGKKNQPVEEPAWPNPQTPPVYANQAPVQHNAQQWQQPPQQMPQQMNPYPARQSAYLQQAHAGAPSAEQSEASAAIWKKLTLISALVAILFLLGGTICMLMELSAISIVLFVFAIASFVLAIISTILFVKHRNNAAAYEEEYFQG